MTHRSSSRSAVELEAKYRIPSRKAHALCRELGVGTFDGAAAFHRDEYFDDTEGSVARGDFTVRLRVLRSVRGEETARLALKGPRQFGELGQARLEIEAVWPSAEAARASLAGSGLSPVVVIEKRRVEALYQGATVAVDQVPHLGWFCEVEAASQEHLLSCSQALQLSSASEVKDNYTELLKREAPDETALPPFDVFAVFSDESPRQRPDDS